MNRLGMNQYRVKRKPPCNWKGCSADSVVPYRHVRVCETHWDAILECKPDKRDELIEVNLGIREGSLEADRAYVRSHGTPDLAVGVPDPLDGRAVRNR